MKIKIIIDFVRHAFSCANVIFVTGTDIKTIHSDSHDIAHDAVLTDLGINQAQQFNTDYRERILGMDMIFCSELRRCMETAVIACKNLHSTIYCIPFIGETNLSNDNCPIEFISHTNLTIDEIFARTISKTYMNQYYPTFKGYPVIDNHILLERQDPLNPSPTISNDFEFYHWVIPRIFQILSNDPKKGFIDNDGIKTYRIMAFSHYGHIRSHFGFNRSKKLDNNHYITGPKIYTDSRFNDRMDDFISNNILDNPSPHNVNMYTEIIDFFAHDHSTTDYDRNKIIKTQMAEPCDCCTIVNKCQKYHQIKLRDQVVDDQIKWNSLSHCDVHRCLTFHPLFKKYYDMISFVNEYDEYKKKYIDLKHNL